MGEYVRAGELKPNPSFTQGSSSEQYSGLHWLVLHEWRMLWLHQISFNFCRSSRTSMTLGHVCICTRKCCLRITASGCQALQDKHHALSSKQNTKGKNSCQSWQLLESYLQTTCEGKATNLSASFCSTACQMFELWCVHMVSHLQQKPHLVPVAKHRRNNCQTCYS